MQPILIMLAESVEAWLQTYGLHFFLGISFSTERECLRHSILFCKDTKKNTNFGYFKTISYLCGA